MKKLLASTVVVSPLIALALGSVYGGEDVKVHCQIILGVFISVILFGIWTFAFTYLIPEDKRTSFRRKPHP